LDHPPIEVDIISDKQSIVVWWLVWKARKMKHFTGERIAYAYHIWLGITFGVFRVMAEDQEAVLGCNRLIKIEA